ncbi:MAG: OmpA family protein [Bacteroidota bacterium]
MKTSRYLVILFMFMMNSLLMAQEEQNDAQSVQVQTLKATSKYDFIPGETVIFYDDFSQDLPGDYPPLWNTDGSGEIVTLNNYPGKWLQPGSDCSQIPLIKKDFPDNYTVEFDVVPLPGSNGEESIQFGFYIYGALNPDDFNEGGAIPGVGGIKFTFGSYTQYYSTYNEGAYVADAAVDKNLFMINQKVRLSFTVQKTRIRAFINDVKVFDVAKAMFPDVKYNVLRFITNSEAIPLISNFRFAVGAPDMRNKLITEGKLVTYGIYFDSGSDEIKPESAGTLKMISDILKENPAVSITIVGHTDSDGDDTKNLDLSKRRAVSVKNILSGEYGIEASRLHTDGKGETVPVAPNTNSEGKAKNRRVELIKT